MARHLCGAVNCCAFSIKPRKNTAIVASALAAGFPCACELIRRIVVRRAFRVLADNFLHAEQLGQHGSAAMWA